MRLFHASILMACLAISSQAATITFSGLVSDVGPGFYFGVVPVGTALSGSVEVTSVGPDTNAAAQIGDYLFTVGTVQLSVQGVGNFSFDAGSAFDSIRAVIFNSVESGIDEIEFTGSTPFGQVVVRLFGDATFLSSANFPLGNGDFNWAAFTGGEGTFQNFSVLVPTAATEAPTDGFAFTVGSVNDVPEPGTVFGVLAGGIVLFLKRRQSR